MKHLDELKDMLWMELDKVAEKGELSAGDLDIVQKLTHSIKSIDTIEAMEGYSRDDYMHGNSYTRMRRGRYSMDDGRHDMIDHLEDMLETAQDGKVKKAIREAIHQIGG